MSAPWLLLFPVAAFAAASTPPVDSCPDLYETCLETCRVDHGLEKSRRKLTRCVHRCETRRARCANDGPAQPGPRRDDASNAVVRHIAPDPGPAAPPGASTASALASPEAPAPATSPATSPATGAPTVEPESPAGAKERPASAGAVAPGGDPKNPLGAKPVGGDAVPAEPALEHSQSVVAPRSTPKGASPASAGAKSPAAGASQAVSPDDAFERGGEP